MLVSYYQLTPKNTHPPGVPLHTQLLTTRTGNCWGRIGLLIMPGLKCMLGKDHKPVPNRVLTPNHMSVPNSKKKLLEEKVPWNDVDGRSSKNQNINKPISEISESSFVCQSQKDR